MFSLHLLYFVFFCYSFACHFVSNCVHALMNAAPSSDQTRTVCVRGRVRVGEEMKHMDGENEEVEVEGERDGRRRHRGGDVCGGGGDGGCGGEKKEE